LSTKKERIAAAKLLGSARSKKKTKACRKNAKKPRRKAIQYNQEQADILIRYRNDPKSVSMADLEKCYGLLAQIASRF